MTPEQIRESAGWFERTGVGEGAGPTAIRGPCTLAINNGRTGT